MDAAEHSFSYRGYDGSTIRDIAGKAASNLAVLSNHWGSKEALFREIFRTRFAVIQQEQWDRLSELKTLMSDGVKVPLRAILAAHIEPVFLLGLEDQAEASRLRLMYGRALMDPSEEVRSIMGETFTANAQLFFDLLRRALPEMDPVEFYWRANCVIGSFMYAETYASRLDRYMSDVPSDQPMVVAAQHVIDFVTAGLCAEEHAGRMGPESWSTRPAAKKAQ